MAYSLHIWGPRAPIHILWQAIQWTGDEGRLLLRPDSCTTQAQSAHIKMAVENSLLHDIARIRKDLHRPEPYPLSRGEIAAWLRGDLQEVPHIPPPSPTAISLARLLPICIPQPM